MTKIFPIKNFVLNIPFLIQNGFYFKKWICFKNRSKIAFWSKTVFGSILNSEPKLHFASKIYLWIKHDFYSKLIFGPKYSFEPKLLFEIWFKIACWSKIVPFDPKLIFESLTKNRFMVPNFYLIQKSGFESKLSFDQKKILKKNNIFSYLASYLHQWYNP